MRTSKTVRVSPLLRYLPSIMHVGELVIGLVLLAAVQNFWAVLAGASPDISPPSVPTGLALSGRSATEIDISWNASTDDVAVTGYHIYRGGVLRGDSATTDYADTGLAPNTSYTYTVSAYDAVPNTSAESNPLNASTLADTAPPSVPQNVHQTGQTTNSVSLAWDASNDNVGVLSYDIYRNGALVRSQPGTTYTDTGLAVYTSYTYNIAARDAANNGSILSTSLNAATAQDTTAPTVPDNLRKVSSTVSSISLTWDSSTDNVGIAGYRLYRDGAFIGSTGGTTYTDSGLNVSSSYSYTVQAYDAAGNSSTQSAPYVTSSSADVTPPSAPTNLRATTVLDTSISFAWDASTDDVAVTGYKLYRDGALIGTTTVTSYTDTGLQPVTQYSYTIKAYDAANNVSLASAALVVTTAYDTTAPTVPTNLRTTAITDTTISLAWDLASDNVAVTGYDLYRGGSLITTTTGTSFTDSGLATDTAYSYRIRAHDASSNNSAQSSPLATATIPDTVAPATPANLVSASQTTTSVSLSWDAATDDASPANQIVYKLYRDGVLVITQPGLSHVDSGLHYGRAYSYSVTSVDASGNESLSSSSLSVSTLPDTSPPSVVIDTPADGQTAQLTFQISATASDDLELNRVEFYADSTLIATTTTLPYALNWNSYAVHNGAHILSAKAIDASGNQSSRSITVTINNPPPPITGDLNGDHKVNIYDLSILLSHFNKPGAGDFNNNGKVDIFDLSVLLSRFGSDNSNYQ
ncbi:MAG: fibronectin type III domain-containing protein [Candidatus Saccharimonadales bacterium]